MAKIEKLSAITLATHDMARSVAFYRSIGFDVAKGGETAAFTTLAAGEDALNLILAAPDVPLRWWGRVILFVDDVDAMHRAVVDAGYSPDFAPSDAPWGERYFHVTDPDGHEISFARPLSR
ncbi:VOC family protein [Thalassobaculum salexigens]|uniref:VOC family protein n=1 Tax=Thalassobaculum salexigens TaxID=455360 RepID=UPI000418E232|nr:VOC family protein [Thalassobaculum salexigens]